MPFSALPAPSTLSPDQARRYWQSQYSIVHTLFFTPERRLMSIAAMRGSTPVLLAKVRTSSRLVCVRAY